MAFEPDAVWAIEADRRMRARLADSLSYVFGQAGDWLEVDPGSARRLVADVRDRPQSAQLFGCYYDLVLALDDDDEAGARRFAAELVSPRGTSGRVTAVQDRSAAEAGRCSRLFLGDALRLQPVDDEVRVAATARIDAALRILGRGYPSMAAEIDVLVREIVLATDRDDGTGASPFHGASSFMLWRAVLLNAGERGTRLDAVQSLVHESGHNLLFGHSLDGPLVLNRDDERFASPLRADARTMDGVFHATFVVARVHRTLARLIEADVLTAAETEAARIDLATHAASFVRGDRTVREGAALTPAGLAVMDAAREYMASAS